MRTYLKFIAYFAIIACACGGFTSKLYSSSDAPLTKIKGHDSDCSCERRAHQRALEINAAIDATFPLLVPATAAEGAAAYASFFAEDGVFQFPGGIVSGKDAIYAVYLAYAENPGEMNQHVITRESYWDAHKATLTVERTWFATLTIDTTFCGTLLPAGTTYSQDDALIVRFACDHHCHEGCILPGKVVYYHEYFDTCQFQSDYSDDYPHPCHNLGES